MKPVNLIVRHIFISLVLVFSIGACSTVKEKFSLRGQGEV